MAAYLRVYDSRHLLADCSHAKSILFVNDSSTVCCCVVDVGYTLKVHNLLHVRLQLHYFDLLWIFVQFVSAVVQQWTGFRLEQRILGQLSLASLRGRLIEYQ